MSVVKLLGFNALPCGCLVGRYRQVATQRQVTYVEEKGQTCDQPQHRTNHTVSPGPQATARPVPATTAS